MLYLPVQLLTLWDFHVLDRMDAWRGVAGPHVRRWFAAAGEFEALAALAALAHDHPDWSFPELLDEDGPTLAGTRLGHPMLLGTKVWAFAHLLANGTLADVLLFGGFLAWAVLCFRSARRRDRAAGRVYAAGSVRQTAIALIAGVVAWALFAFWLHAAWIGVAPLGASA